MSRLQSVLDSLSARAGEAYPSKANPYTVWQSDGAWTAAEFCDSFAQYGAVEIGGFAWPDDSQFGYKGHAYVPWSVDSARRLGIWHEPSEVPEPGWQPVYDWNHNGSADHIGGALVELLHPPPHLNFIAIEGNVGGGAVAFCQRDDSFLLGWIAPGFSAEPQPIPPTVEVDDMPQPAGCWDGAVYTIAARGDNGECFLRRRKPLGGQGDWDGDYYSIGGILTSGPDIVCDGHGDLHVVARGTDLTVAITSRVKGVWTGWQRITSDDGGYATSGPSIQIGPADRLDVLARGRDEAVWHTWRPHGGLWLPHWESFGGNT